MVPNSIYRVFIREQSEPERVFSISSRPLELVERSIFVLEPTPKHSVPSRESRYNSSFQQPKPTTSLVFQTLFSLYAVMTATCFSSV